VTNSKEVALTILTMAVVTYATRVGGFLLLRNRKLSPRAKSVLEAIPGAVLIAVIAPVFVSKHPADLLPLTLTVIVATRLSLLWTVLVGVTAAAFFRHFL
jgi:uncharacterized membrane protein